MRRTTLVAAVAGACLAIVPAAALGADAPTPTTVQAPEAAPLVAPPPGAYTAPEGPEQPPAPPGEVSPPEPAPPLLPVAPPSPPGEVSP